MNDSLEMRGEKSISVGYMQTEVGIIPRDWVVEPLENFTAFISYGFTNPMPTTTSGPFMITARDIANGRIQYNSARTTDLNAFNKLLTSKSKPQKNDLLLTKDGTLGRLALAEDELICINQSVAILRPNKRIIPKFFQLLLESPFYQVRMLEDAGGSTIKHIYITIVNRMLIGLPTDLKEQKSIATALSDTDDLITALEQLIAKKQDIKTATMQQLLTGRTRLAQFAKQPNETLKGYKTSELGMIPEDWEAKPFGELFESSLHRRTMRKEDIVSFVGMQDVSENAQLIEQSQLSFSEVKGGFTYFEKGDVLVAKITPCFENGKGCHTESLLTDIGFGSTEFHVLRAKNSSHSKFIYYWTTNTNLRKVLESEMVGSAGHRRVPLSAIQNYLIPCPQTKIEQTAIATILSDMDDELEALEQKLAKVRDIKQGMMQQLLTGRIRLPLDHQP
ncbi:restriction endonuclease subunit S [Enterobacter ludwigii]|uniref:restriction endonuclease subunit S n=1 Tax=Enterobacter ludwigii TaxID=299767 RepID=UPI002A186B7A|nr:restriction endonuclease subunit S [Enterobacter ludwigii]WPL53641.1 restriction endonuclease subunit S [Enterobacter ludwigii]